MPNKQSRSIAGHTQPTHRLNQIADAFLRYPLLILTAYFIFNIALRTMLGAPPKLDEAEQFAISTHYSFGYGPHPPLYQWLQVTVFQIFGVNYFAIAVLKNTILFGTYAMLYLLGMLLTRNRILAVVGCMGLMFSVNFAWESQHDQSHTVSNTFLIVLTVYLFFKTLDYGSPLRYVLLGVAIGLGLMAKPNFIFPLVAIILVFSSDANGRRLFMHPLVVLTLILAVSIPSYHFLYIAENLVEATSKVSKLGLDDFSFLQSRVMSIASFTRAFLSVFAVWMVLIALFWFDRRKNRHLTGPNPRFNDLENTAISEISRDPVKLALFRKFCITTFGLLILFVLIAGTTRFRDHWLQPVAVFAPLLIAIQFRGSFSQDIFRRLTAMVAVLLVIIPFASVLNNLGIGARRMDAAMPDPAMFAQAVPQVVNRPVMLVFSDSRYRYRWYTAGHLRSYFPLVKMVFDPEQNIATGSEFWLVWRAKTANLAKAKNLYSGLRKIPSSVFEKPIKIGHLRPDQLGKFKETSWWVARYAGKN